MELTDLVKMLRAHWASIVSITLLGGLLAFGFALVQPKVYTSNASGIISTGQNEELGVALAGDNYAKSRVKSYLDLAESRAVAEIVIEDLGLEATPGALLSNVSVTNPMDTPTIKVSVSANDPEQASRIAEGWISAIGKQIDAIENDGSSTEGGESIVQFRSLDTAQVPTAPTSPNIPLIVAIGLALGLAAAITYAFIRSLFDRRVLSIEGVEEETGKSVIGTVPLHQDFNKTGRIIATQGGNDRADRAGAEYAVAEALRELRTNLQFMDVDNPPRRIVITSALPSEGKSIIVANLANTIAASGQRVVVIDGDLRRPMVAKTFGVVPGAGLTDVLIGKADVKDLLQPFGTTGNLFVLAAGKIPPNPSELLASNAMGALIDDLAEHAMVLIDAPPLLPVTDSAILSARTDGALVVAYARRTTYDQLNEALGNLERVSAKALGVIINAVPMKGTAADGYGYRNRYYSYYGANEEDLTSPAPTPPAKSGAPLPEATAETAHPGTTTPTAEPRSEHIPLEEAFPPAVVNRPSPHTNGATIQLPPLSRRDVIRSDRPRHIRR